MPEEEVVRDM